MVASLLFAAAVAVQAPVQDMMAGPAKWDKEFRFIVRNADLFSCIPEEMGR